MSWIYFTMESRCTIQSLLLTFWRTGIATMRKRDRAHNVDEFERYEKVTADKKIVRNKSTTKVIFSKIWSTASLLIMHVVSEVRKHDSTYPVSKLSTGALDQGPNWNPSLNNVGLTTTKRTVSHGSFILRTAKFYLKWWCIYSVQFLNNDAISKLR